MLSSTRQNSIMINKDKSDKNKSNKKRINKNKNNKKMINKDKSNKKMINKTSRERISMAERNIFKELTFMLCVIAFVAVVSGSSEAYGIGISGTGLTDTPVSEDSIIRQEFLISTDSQDGLIASIEVRGIPDEWTEYQRKVSIMKGRPEKIDLIIRVPEGAAGSEWKKRYAGQIIITSKNKDREGIYVSPGIIKKFSFVVVNRSKDNEDAGFSESACILKQARLEGCIDKIPEGIIFESLIENLKDSDLDIYAEITIIREPEMDETHLISLGKIRKLTSLKKSIDLTRLFDMLNPEKNNLSERYRYFINISRCDFFKEIKLECRNHKYDERTLGTDGVFVRINISKKTEYDDMVPVHALFFNKGSRYLTVQFVGIAKKEKVKIPFSSDLISVEPGKYQEFTTYIRLNTSGKWSVEGKFIYGNSETEEKGKAIVIKEESFKKDLSDSFFRGDMKWLIVANIIILTALSIYSIVILITRRIKKQEK